MAFLNELIKTTDYIVAVWLDLFIRQIHYWRDFSFYLPANRHGHYSCR